MGTANFLVKDKLSVDMGVTYKEIESKLAFYIHCNGIEIAA